MKKYFLKKYFLKKYFLIATILVLPSCAMKRVPLADYQRLLDERQQLANAVDRYQQLEEVCSKYAENKALLESKVSFLEKKYKELHDSYNTLKKASSAALKDAWTTQENASTNK